MYANLPDILSAMDDYVGRGRITSSSPYRAGEGTTFEASCYTDPLALEHLTGSLSATIAHVGTHEWPAPVGLRFTTKFDDVAPCCPSLTAGGPACGYRSTRPTSRADSKAAPHGYRSASPLGQLARAGYRVGLTIAPIMPIAKWQEGYGALLGDVRMRSPRLPTST